VVVANDPTLRPGLRVRASGPLFMAGSAIASILVDWLFAHPHDASREEDVDCREAMIAGTNPKK
jgi:hypothetical protein